MTKCPNCGRAITCSCQLKVASNGTKVCSSCLLAYETSLNTTSKTDDQTLTLEQRVRLIRKTNNSQ